MNDGEEEPMKQVLQIMTYQGHEEIKFDPNDPEDVKKTKDMIKEKMKQGYMLAVGKAGSDEPLEMVKDANKLDDPEFDRFFLMPDTKKVLTAPVTGG